MIDRINGPTIQAISNAEFPKHEVIQLSNGMKLFILHADTQEIFKLELIFRGGRRYEAERGVARMCATLMKEGIPDKNSEQLAEYWDYYGAIVNSYSDLDICGITLTSLNKYHKELLPVWTSCLTEPTFPTAELDLRKQLFTEKLQRDLSKNDIVCYRELTEKLYGKEHFYGYNTQPEDFASIDISKIKRHYEDYWGANRGFAILSGNITPDLKNSVIDALATLPQASRIYESENVPPSSNDTRGKTFQFPTENKMQATFKVGNVCLDRTDPDYPAFYLLVEILGGYFGSRLMKKIREEMGLCYNIYATIDRLQSSNYFYISADVNAEKVEESMKEIRSEIDILINEPISESELNMVKSYISGKLLAGLDGPFRSSQLLKLYLSHELDFDYFYDFTESLRQIDSKALQQIAKRHLNWSEMTTVIVGP